MYKEELQEVVSICKLDEHKRYIWVKLCISGKPIFIAGCYIPHRESPFYDTHNVEKNDPFVDLYGDIATYAQEGMVMIIGDLNARIANAQVQLIDYSLHPADKEGDLTLDPLSIRCSSDQTMNTQGSAMLSMMNSMQLVAMNGAKKFAHSGTYTCYTANHGMSTNDYALVRYDALEMVHQFEVGGRSPNSNHTPLHVWLRMSIKIKENIRNSLSWSYKMQTLNKNDYADFLDRILLKHNMSDDIEESWDIFLHALEEAAETIMGRTKKWKQDVKGLPHNPWFDEECKVAKRMLRTVPHSTEEWNHAMKKYNILKRRKRRMYELAKEEQDVKQFKRDPKRSWRQMKGRKADIMGDFSPKDIYDYVRKLYAPKEVQRMTDATIQVKMEEPITFRATMKGLKKLAIGKASDTLKFSSEMLKWSGNEAKKWMHGMMNKAVLQGLPSDWQENWIKALFKGGDRNQLTNYRTIMKLQKKFLCRYMGVKATTPYSVMLLETGKRLLEMLALQRVHKYIMKVKLMPKSRIPHIAWDIGCKPQKNYKSKFLTSSFVQDIRKWFAKWNVEAYVDMPILEGIKDEHALNFDIMLLESLHTKWQNDTSIQI
ncbi:hypothetical protein L7F22_030641 [Adiantum nelumboides]|nr:hypothetical protein [Adiantum nelumboides]